MQGKSYFNFEELKQILTSLYQDKKHYIRLMDELNILKQGLNESVVGYHDRIDQLVIRLMDTMSFKDANERLGKIEKKTIKELALSRFMCRKYRDFYGRKTRRTSRKLLVKRKKNAQ